LEPFCGAAHPPAAACAQAGVATKASNPWTKAGKDTGSASSKDDGSGAANEQATSGPDFIAAKTFGSAKPGYMFQAGAQGTGYYKEAAKSGAAASAKAPSKQGTLSQQDLLVRAL
jgi:hypothetical protein